MAKEFGPFIAMVPQFHRDPAGVLVNDPPMAVPVIVAVDFDKLTRKLAGKASRNKSRRATVAGGCVVVKEVR